MKVTIVVVIIVFEFFDVAIADRSYVKSWVEIDAVFLVV